MPSSSLLISTPSLSPSLAQTLLSASLAHAASINVPINIWIFDPSLHPLLFHRMEGAKLTSIDIAYNKALTAAGHRLSTDKYGARINTDLVGIGNSNGGRFCTIAGGEPVLVGGQCVAGVGVSGGTPAEDKASLPSSNPAARFGSFLSSSTPGTCADSIQEIALAGIKKILQILQAEEGKVKAKL